MYFWRPSIVALSAESQQGNFGLWASSVRFILLIRDPRDAVVEHVLSGPGKGLNSSSLQAVLRDHWFFVPRLMQMFDWYADKLPYFFPVLVVNYDDLVRQLPAELQRLRLFLGLNVSQAAVDSHASDVARRDPDLRAPSIGHWRNVMTPDTARFFRNQMLLHLNTELLQRFLRRKE
jgi:hypothetical protein